MYSYVPYCLFVLVCICMRLYASVYMCVCDKVCTCVCVSVLSPAWCVTLTAQNQHEIPQSFSADLSLA